MATPVALGVRPDGLVPGPQHPIAGTPPRRPGSVRRTTHLDRSWSEPGEPQRLRAHGRDLATRADGTLEVVEEVRLELTADAAHDVTALAVEPPEPALDQLVGHPVSRGLRSRVDQLLPEHRARARVLHQLLDDVPMAVLISSYGVSREAPAFALPPGAADRMSDLCAGWAAEGTMLEGVARTGHLPLPVGPPAPDLSVPDDPWAWHDLPPMERRSVRRQRRLDLLPGGPGEPLVVDVHFRDSHRGADGLVDVLHEYTLAATIDPGDLTVLSATPTAHVLPWPECPGALASAGRVVGQPVARLRELVATELTGTSTCTHLNDVLRSLAGVTALAAARV